MPVADKLTELGLMLPKPGRPVANYVAAVRAGNLIFISGHGPRRPDGSLVTGKVGREINAVVTELLAQG